MTGERFVIGFGANYPGISSVLPDVPFAKLVEPTGAYEGVTVASRLTDYGIGVAFVLLEPIDLAALPRDERELRLIVVSNEVGTGLVPSSPLGRCYRDLLGEVNETVARGADKVVLLVAGIAVDIKALGQASCQE